MRCFQASFFVACLATGLSIVQTSFAANPVLITPEEAKLPPPKGAVTLSARGVTRGPKVELVSENTMLRSPARIHIKFQTFGGAKVDLNAVQATYLRTPNVDITSRIKPFVNADGIDVPAAELPPGEHMLRISIKDADGRVATTSILLKVEQ